MTKEVYDKSVERLNEINVSYYEKSKPIVTDETYDKMFKELLVYEQHNPINPDSPTQKIGSPVGADQKKFRHKTKMLSLANVFTVTEFEEWYLKTSQGKSNFELFGELKFDGVSLNLIYSKGELIRAITRGDGRVGEDVTETAKTINNVKLRIPNKELIEIRGEVVFLKKDFLKINTERREASKPLYANARNAASGMLRRKRAELGLTFLPWGLGVNNLCLTTAQETLGYIGTQGFEITKHTKLCRTLDDTIDFYKSVYYKRNQLTSEIDGLVFKVNNLEDHKSLGSTARFPRGMIAFKLPYMEATSILLGVIYQVGRTGKITPIAVIKPVHIGGAKVSRVTLHNHKKIAKDDYRVGDKIIVTRSGDVIPKIVKIIKEVRKGNERKVKPLINCPSCGEKLEQSMTCVNINCLARLVGGILHFVKRHSMNIRGIGKEVAEKLVRHGFVKKPSELYTLTKANLMTLEGIESKGAENLLRAIQDSKGQNIARLITGLGIDNIGRTAAKAISLELGLQSFYPEPKKLSTIVGLGEMAQKSFLEYCLKNRAMLEDLMLKTSPTIVKKAIEPIPNNFFKGKNVVITGTFQVPRQVMSEAIRLLGGAVAKKVSGKTDVLVYGTNPGSNLVKANKLQVTTIDSESLGVKYLMEKIAMSNLDLGNRK